jgi:hypothetical protein
VFPDPPQAHEPTEIRVILFNDTGAELLRYAQFFEALFGIGLERHPIGGRQPFVLPPHGQGTTAVTWVPQTIDPHCFYVEIFDSPTAQTPIAVFQHHVYFQAHPNPDAGLFVEVFPYPLRNPLATAANVTLEWTSPITLVGWAVQLDPAQVVLEPGASVVASVVFTYTGGVPLPPGGVQVFDVHSFADGTPIGGFLKEFGPPVRLHLRPEPPFAESEISVNPYPIRPGEPAEICVEVRNVTHQPRPAQVLFRMAPFGIGLPYEPIAPPVEVMIPEMGLRRPCIQWVAPEGGQFGFEVMVETPGFPMPVASQRVLDVSELLLPGQASLLHFPVQNPFEEPMTITLGMVPYIDGWGYYLSQDVLQNMPPHETRFVTLTVAVPPDSPRPPDGSPVMDVEAFVGPTPIGGFRKIYRLWHWFAVHPNRNRGDQPAAESHRPRWSRVGASVRRRVLRSRQSRIVVLPGAVLQLVQRLDCAVARALWPDGGFLVRRGR